MSIAVIADSHIGGPGGPAGPLVEQLDALAGQGCTELLLMGDLFQAWVGFPAFEDDDVRRVVAALRRLREAGVAIHYVEGNRDFFLQHASYADVFTTYGLEHAFEHEGVRYLAVHGDGLDPRDLMYRFWRRASKSLLSRWVVRLIPGPLARRLVAATEEKLSLTNMDHKRHIPEHLICNYAADRFEEGHDVLLMGHFHEPLCLTLDAGRIHVLDAWFKSRRVEWLPLTPS
jgi:UDP-2,3-diacylglucosamine hydrolase